MKRMIFIIWGGMVCSVWIFCWMETHKPHPWWMVALIGTMFVCWMALVFHYAISDKKK